MTYYAEEALRAHTERMSDLRLRRNMIDLEIADLETETFFTSLDFAAKTHSQKPYSPPERCEPEETWVDFTQDPRELDLYISPTDVLVKMLNTAFKPWYVNSVHYTIDAQLQSLTLNVRLGGTLVYLLMLCNPFLTLMLSYIIKRRMEKCDLMPEITTLRTLEVDVFWCSPGYSGLEDIRDAGEIVALTMSEDQRLLDSYLNKSMAQLPFEITEEEEVSLYV